MSRWARVQPPELSTVMPAAPQSFQTTERRARLAMNCCRLSVFASVLTTLGATLESQASGRIAADQISPSWAELVEIFSLLIATLALAAFILTAIAFLVWFYRTRANLPALGIGDARWSPGWAVGWWFIPVMSLFRPYQVAFEICKASDPQATPADWRARPAPSLLAWWWAFGISVELLGYLWIILWISADEFPAAGDTPNLDLLDRVAPVVDMLWAWSTIRVIAEIQRRQTERRQILAFT